MLMNCHFLTLRLKELPQQGGTVGLQHPGPDLWAVAVALIEQVDDAAAGTGERLARTENPTGTRALMIAPAHMGQGSSVT